MRVEQLAADTDGPLTEATRPGGRRRGRPRKSHCLHGHPYSGENVYVDPQGVRHCRACGRRRNEQARVKRRAERPAKPPRPRPGPKAPPSGSRTHCPNGHPYAGDNLYLDPQGHRHCRSCMRRWSAEAYAKRKAARPPRRRRTPLRTGPKNIHNGLKSHCPKGHSYAGDNLYVDPKGGRRCLQCKFEARERARPADKPRRQRSPDARPLKRGLRNQFKTHCPLGHPSEQANVYVDPKGYRRCRECKRLSRKRAA